MYITSVVSPSRMITYGSLVLVLLIATVRSFLKNDAELKGLDPALPLFSYNDDERLKPSSAGFVDVIHTCGQGIGFYDDLGHADFYPNNGTAGQPGCPAIFSGGCSHQRAIELYAESISTHNGFLGRKCDNWSEFTEGKCDNNPTDVMGEYVSRRSRKILAEDRGFVSIRVRPRRWKPNNNIASSSII